MPPGREFTCATCGEKPYLLSIKARIKYNEVALGDVKDTFADTSAARAYLGFKPAYSLEQGLQAEINWVKANLKMLQEAGPCFS